MKNWHWILIIIIIILIAHFSLKEYYESKINPIDGNWIDKLKLTISQII